MPVTVVEQDRKGNADEDALPETPIERWAVREVLAGIRQVVAGSGYGSVTLFVRDSEGDGSEIKTRKKSA